MDIVPFKLRKDMKRWKEGQIQKPRLPPNPNVSVIAKLVSEYDQEIPQSQTADNPVAQRGRAPQPSQDTRKTN